MSNHGIRYVKLHIPGRSGLYCLLISLVVLGVLMSVAARHYWGNLIVIWIVVVPLTSIIIEFRSRKRIVDGNKSHDSTASGLKELGLRWLYFRRGGGCHPWRREELGLPRTIADISLQVRLKEIEIPDGLIEPEAVRISKPGSVLGCLFGSVFSALLVFGAVRYAIQGPAFHAIGWVLAVIFALNIVQLVLNLPVVHRSRNLPAILRHFGRRESLRKAFTVGPGWVKFKKRVWRADRDMLLIRRTGWRRAAAEIDCLLAGPEGRRRLTFSGVGDDDFRILFGGWNVAEVRTEWIDSELS